MKYWHWLEGKYLRYSFNGSNRHLAGRISGLTFQLLSCGGQYPLPFLQDQTGALESRLHIQQPAATNTHSLSLHGHFQAHPQDTVVCSYRVCITHTEPMETQPLPQLASQHSRQALTLHHNSTHRRMDTETHTTNAAKTAVGVASISQYKQVQNCIHISKYCWQCLCPVGH